MLSNARGRTWRVILSALLFVVASSAALASGENFLSCSSQNHLWFVTEFGQRRTSFVLCHHADDMGGAFFRPQTTLAQMPVAIASWDRRVWLAFAPQQDAVAFKWEVFTIQVLKNPLGVYYSEPADHLDIVAPLFGSGQLLAMVGTANGPVALLLPEPDPGSRVTNLQLRRLYHDQWLEIEAPDDLRIDSDSRLSSEGSRGEILSLFAPSKLNPGHCTKHSRDAFGQWNSSELPLGINRLSALTKVGNQLVAAMLSNDSNQMEIGYVRPRGLVSLATVPRPTGSWDVLGMERSLKLLERDGDGKLAIRTIDPLDGHISSLQPLELQRLDAGRLMEFSILLGALVTALLLAFLIRPAAGALVVLPSGRELMPLGVRLSAFLIDVIPGAVLTLLVFRCPISELLMLPVMTLDFQHSSPHLFMAGITMFHSTVGEITRRTTLGKSILGGEVASTHGSRAGVGQVVLRNGLKAVVLLIPPLAVVTVLTRHLQGLPDVAARTVVIHGVQEQMETDGPIE